MNAVRRLAPWLVGLVGVAVAVVVLVEATARTDLADERDSRQYTSRAVGPLVQELREQREAAGTAVFPGTRTVGIDDPDGPSADVAALARDTGEPVIDDRSGGVVIVARFDPAAPTTVAARRAGLVGFSLVPLVLDDVLEAAEGGDGAIALRGPTATVAATRGYDDIAADAVAYSVPLARPVGPGWRVDVVSARSPIPLAAWVGAVLALLAGVAGALLTWRTTARARARAEAFARRGRVDGTLAELSTVSQSSLDLAEVLPASFALLESALDLDGITMLSANARPTFVWRDAPSEHEAGHPLRPPLAAGTCIDVPLARTGRSLGVLKVRLGRDLDDVDARTLGSAAETLSSAVANAEAYAHQRALITRMRALDDLKTVFVATASHELRTPVAAIIGYASMLNEGWDTLESDQGKLYAQRVDSNAQRLAALVEHLLDFSRLEQHGTDAGDDVVLDLGAEVQEVLDASIDLTPDHRLLAGLEPGVTVSGSKLAIERVLVNLVGNAAKYSPAGTTIRVRVEGGDAARLIVDDEGPGVPEEEREQIFSRFFRGKGDEVIRTRGAGLGLAIVTEFAASMHGQVSIDSAPTGGTRFQVTYPLHQGVTP